MVAEAIINLGERETLDINPLEGLVSNAATRDEIFRMMVMLSLFKPKEDLDAIIYARQSYEFTDDEISEAKRLAIAPPADPDGELRWDLRDQSVPIAIDSDSTLDVDDAVYCERDKETGEEWLYVHVADPTR
jgi:exoribonuclease R